MKSKLFLYRFYSKVNNYLLFKYLKLRSVLPIFAITSSSFLYMHGTTYFPLASTAPNKSFRHIRLIRQAFTFFIKIVETTFIFHDTDSMHKSKDIIQTKWNNSQNILKKLNVIRESQKQHLAIWEFI